MTKKTVLYITAMVCLWYVLIGSAHAVEVVVTILTEDGGRVDWSHKHNLIAFDRMGSDGYFDVWVMKPDGSEQRCLTCNASALPQKHIGNPAWHPSGQLIVFQAQKENVPIYVDNECTPGAGVLNDLWVMTADGQRYWKLYSVSDEVSRDSEGVLHPQFSHDGTRLIWSERVRDNGRPFGEWVMRSADFRIRLVGPRLQNIRTIKPSLVSAFYETHSFSPNDRYFLFTGNQHGGLEIYEYDLVTRSARRLTRDLSIWDEHAHYSNDGGKIVWMSNRGLQAETPLKTELWVMDRSGLNRRQLTYFNFPDHPHYLGETAVITADNSWGPVGDRLAVTLSVVDPSSDYGFKGLIAIITFE